MMRPGDRVDVLVTYQVRNTRGAMTTKTSTLLEYVEVFATDNRTMSDGVSKQQEVKTKVVSLLVFPAQVSYIKLAESKGSLALAWRHPDDDEDVQTGSIDDGLLNELAGLEGMQTDGVPNYERRGPALFDEDTVAEPSSQTELTNLLDESGNAPPPVAAAPARPTWNLQIYQGDTPTETTFELPEQPVVPGGEAADPSLTEAFKWLHETFTNGQGQTSSSEL
jgi:pilus assembly protein CpaB